MGGTDGYHLAQVNIALPQAPLDSEQLAGFVERLEPVNALADAAPGFVWRLQTEDGDATGIRAFGDDRLIVNNRSRHRRGYPRLMQRKSDSASPGWPIPDASSTTTARSRSPRAATWWPAPCDGGTAKERWR